LQLLPLPSSPRSPSPTLATWRNTSLKSLERALSTILPGGPYLVVANATGREPGTLMRAYRNQARTMAPTMAGRRPDYCSLVCCYRKLPSPRFPGAPALAQGASAEGEALPPLPLSCYRNRQGTRGGRLMRAFRNQARTMAPTMAGRRPDYCSLVCIYRKLPSPSSCPPARGGRLMRACRLRGGQRWQVFGKGTQSRRAIKQHSRNQKRTVRSLPRIDSYQANLDEKGNAMNDFT
jgi:hypothetical protein